jgi:hypothetical protein
VNPNNPQAASQSREVREAARTIRQQVLILNAGTERELEAAFAVLAEKRVGAPIIGADSFFNSQPAQLAAPTARHAMPAISPWREHVAAGSLILVDRPEQGARLQQSTAVVGDHALRHRAFLISRWPAKVFSVTRSIANGPILG